MRTGVIAEKVGMMSLFQKDGTSTPVTVLKIDGCTVVDVRTKERDGYVAVQLGAGKAKVKNLSKAVLGHYKKANVEPKKTLQEFRVSDDCVLNIGDEIGANHFVVGQLVDVSGVSVGKGYAGVMKKYHFGGDCASHGVSRTHRAGGSTGQREWPGKVFKNLKMPGQMGNKQVTEQNLEVVAIDEDRGLVMVKGSVPGFDSNTVIITDAVKVKHKDLPMPAGLKQKAKAEVAEAPAQAEAAAEPAGAQESEVKE